LFTTILLVLQTVYSWRDGLILLCRVQKNLLKTNIQYVKELIISNLMLYFHLDLMVADGDFIVVDSGFDGG